MSPVIVKDLDGSKCPECGMQCKTLASLSHHMNAKHAGPKLVEKRELEQVLQEKFPELKISVSCKTIYYDAYAAEGTVIELQAFLNLVKIADIKLERRVF